MKKRAVLFLLVLCAVLCLATPAMAATKFIVAVHTVEKVKNDYTEANTEGDPIELQRNLNDIDMSGPEWKLQTKMLLASESTYTTMNSSKLTIGEDGILATKGDTCAVFASDIINYGTIESGIYTGTIINYGTITGGTFWGTVINATDDTNTGSVPAVDNQSADLSKATLMVRDTASKDSDGKNDPSFNGAYIDVTLKLADDEHIDGDPSSPLKVMRGTSIWPSKPTRDGDPATTSTVFAYWCKEGTNSFYSHDNLYFTGSQITLTPVWCDHVVILDVNQPAGSTLVSNNMFPVAFYKSEPSKDLFINSYVCFRTAVNKNEKLQFLCWNTRKDGKGLSYSGDIKSLDKLAYTAKFDPNEPQTTLYARWVEAAVTGKNLTYIYQRDEEGTETQPEDKKANLICYQLKQNMFTPVRGQKFVGWHVQNIYVQDTDKPILFQSGDTILTTQLGENAPSEENRGYIHITAQWQPLPVTEITFDANGTGVTGTTGNSNKEIYYEGETLPLPNNGFARTNYAFTGWNTEPDGTGTGYGDGADITITGDALVSKKVTLYAQWNPVPIVEITFDGNGSGVTGETGNGNKKTYYDGDALTLPTNGFARTNYAFTGWNTKADGTGTPYGDGADITITGDELVGKNITLYAQWKSTVTPTPTPSPTPTPQPTTPPKTGDASNQSLWLALCMVSVAAMVGLIALNKRRFSRR